MRNCFICGNPSEGVFTNIHEPIFNCSVCGNYSITDIAMNTIPTKKYQNWKSVLQKHISDNQHLGVVVINSGTKKSLFGF